MIDTNVGKNVNTRVKKYPNIRNRHFIMLDILIVVLSYVVSVFLVYDKSNYIDTIIKGQVTILFSLVVFIAVMIIFGIYTVMWIHAGTKDYIRIIKACVVSDIILACVGAFVLKEVSIRVEFFALAVANVSFLMIRMLARGIHDLSVKEVNSNDPSKKRLLIVGAGSAATIMLKDLTRNSKLNYSVVGFIDDDDKKRNASINGVRVLGNRHSIRRIAAEKKVDEILIAMPSASPTEIKRIIEVCNNTKCKVKILPSVDQSIGSADTKPTIRNVEIEDLLAREPIKLDNTEISSYIKDKTILVTGGGGSIGSELCRQIMKFNPQKLVVLDIYENNAYDLQMELNRKYPDNKPEVVIASVRDYDRLEMVFEKFKPYIVFHAAAHKHVPLMEDSPGEAIKNNVFGTLNVAKCADKYGVKRFVMISTDKAVNPTNVMGATKRICEMIIQLMQQRSNTEFVAVRFGNVLGSNGSVIPLFKKQIAQGGPVTVTDKRITRYFMTIPEAAQLVLQAASYAKGGEIFVLDMGQPVKIYDLAKNLIKLSGYTPNVDMHIEVCGLRPGEKLYEELLMDEEGLTNTEHKKIFIGRPIDINGEEFDAMLDKLKNIAENDDIELIKDTVSEIVPTYVRKK